MATAPTTINIRRKSCIIVFSVVPIPCLAKGTFTLKCICQARQVQVCLVLSDKLSDIYRVTAAFSNKNLLIR
ncbi:hypothetical protein GCM10009413_29390 [Tatumella punctata]